MDNILNQQQDKQSGNNVIRLADVISLATRKRPISKLPSDRAAEIINFPTQQATAQPTAPDGTRGVGNKSRSSGGPSLNDAERSRLERESILFGSKYLANAGDYLADAKNKYTSIEGLFDLDKSKGLFANILKRKVASDRYVKDQLDINPDLKNIPGYKNNLRQEFNKQQSIQKQQQIVEGKISGLRERGYTDQQIEKSGLFNKRASLDDQMAQVNPSYREKRDIDREQINQPKNKPTGVINTLSNDAINRVDDQSTSEEERENIQLMREQNTSLKNIEQYTSAIPALAQAIEALQGKQLEDQTKTTSRQPIIPDIDIDRPVGKTTPTTANKQGRFKNILGKGKNYLNKLGGLKSLAGRVGGGAAIGLAGMGIEYGGSKLKDAGYEESGKAVSTLGTATKYAGVGAMIGSFIPGIGTTIGAGVGATVGLAVGGYNQYFSDDKDKSKIIEESASEGKVTIPGVGNVSFAKNNDRYLINENPVDKQTYEKFILLKHAIFNPKTNPDYKPTYEKALESANAQGKTGLDAQFEAEAAVEKAVVPEIVKIVSSIGGTKESSSTQLTKATEKSATSVIPKDTGNLTNSKVVPIHTIKPVGSRQSTGQLTGIATNSQNYSITDKNMPLAGLPSVTQQDADSSGNVSSIIPGPEIAGNVIKMQPSPVNLRGIDQVKTSSSAFGDVVYQTSGDVAAAKTQQPASAPAPVVVNAPSTNVNNQSTIAPGPRSARNSESSVQQYNRSRFF